MPVVEFKPENKKQDEDQFPKLKLDMNEYARIICIEKQPHFEYVHKLTKPRIVAGKPDYKTQKRKDGTEYTALEMDFISQPFCLGDIGIIQDKGSDPVNCPLCAEAANSDIVKPPERRFAMNVFKYTMSPGANFTVAEPFGGQIVAWVFTEKLFSRLADLSTEWGGLQNNDLNLGPITQPPVAYQKFDISVAATAEWKKTQANIDYLKAVAKDGRCPDLSKLCGRKVPAEFLTSDLEEIRNAWLQVKAYESGTPVVTPDAQPAVDLTAGLEGLLDEPVITEPASETATVVPIEEATIRDVAGAAPAPVSVTPDTSLDDLLSDEPASPEAEPVVDLTGVTEAAPTPPAPVGESLDFDDLLAQTD